MWTYKGNIADLQTPRIRLLGERWEDNEGKNLEYWRTENAHSVIVIPERHGELLLPPKAFRPGIGEETFDFPGGRLPYGSSPEDAAYQILERELKALKSSILSLDLLTRQPLSINSSTSNQKLFGFRARLDPTSPEPVGTGIRYSTDTASLDKLLENLVCLQCRSLLFEYIFKCSRDTPVSKI